MTDRDIRLNFVGPRYMTLDGVVHRVYGFRDLQRVFEKDEGRPSMPSRNYTVPTVVTRLDESIDEVRDRLEDERIYFGIPYSLDEMVAALTPGNRTKEQHGRRDALAFIVTSVCDAENRPRFKTVAAALGVNRDQIRRLRLRGASLSNVAFLPTTLGGDMELATKADIADLRDDLAELKALGWGTFDLLVGKAMREDVAEDEYADEEELAA